MSTIEDMKSFYQSGLRKEINKNVYNKPLFEAEFLGKTYRGIVKKKRRMGKEFRRYMIHGVECDAFEKFSEGMRDGCDRLARDHGASRSDILFQVGCVNTFDISPTKQVKKDAPAKELKEQRETIQDSFKNRYGLVPTRREHMPSATVILDTKKPFSKKRLSSSGKRAYNKGAKAGLEFTQLTTKKEWSAYREARYAMAYDKGFHVIPKTQFLDLMEFLDAENRGVLFAGLRDGKLVTGAVYLHYGKQLVYLYGMTNRTFGDIGAQYRLTAQIIDRAHTNDWKSIDLLGVAPVGMEDGHDLAGVTRFKQSFGGETHSYVGSYDLVFNNWLYQFLKRI